jgi:hypothetical protein
MDADPRFQTIQATFAELGAGHDAPVIRTLLLRDRYFVGYCFRCGDLRAILKHGSAEIEFVGADGQALRTVTSPDTPKAMPRAPTQHLKKLLSTFQTSTTGTHTRSNAARVASIT